MYEEEIVNVQTTSRSRISALYCPDCEIDLSDQRLCPQCGSVTIARSNLATSSSSTDNVAIIRGLPSVEDYIRQIFEESLMTMAPSKQISADYLKKLGRIIVDESRSILYDTTLDIGPLRMMAVPASFSSVTLSSLSLCGEFIIGDPKLGDTSLQSSAAGKFVLLERGKVTFAQKALVAEAAGALALVVAQNAPVWPFLMTDNACELSSPGSLRIPVVMISQADATVVESLISVRRTEVALRVTLKDTVCSICQEEVERGHEVLKLHCRHVYHTGCVVSWLESHNTCPLCRLQMPNDEEVKASTRSPNEEGFSLFG